MDLLDSLTALAAAQSLSQIQDIVRRCARALLGADGVTFVLLEDGQCHYAEEDSIEPLWKGGRFPATTCLSGWVMQNNSPAVVPDVFADARIPHDVYRRTFVKSVLMVPIRVHEPVAAIGAYWATPHEPSMIEQRTLQALADAASLALRNAHLVSELQKTLGAERSARQMLSRQTG